MSGQFPCRSCGCPRGELVLDLGVQPLANNFLLPQDLGKPEPRFPLRVFVCPDCWLLQLTDLVPPVELFSEYLYFSSFSDAMLRHASAAAERHCAEMQLGAESRVVEVASNDGYFLRYFQAAGVPCLGVEPALNIAKVAREKGIETWTEFFGLDLAQRLVRERGHADLILANNVFAHAPDINDFVGGLRELLKSGGRIVIEVPYGVELVEQTEFDTIYHEHVFYFTLTALVPLFHRHQLEIFRVERIPIHGGSLRIFAGHAGAQSVLPEVAALLAEERSKGVDQWAFYGSFSDQVRQLKADLLRQIDTCKQGGHSIAAYGASAKGSTLLNYFGIGPATLDYLVDRNPLKHGLYSPGMKIPVRDTDAIGSEKPDVLLVLAWNFFDEIHGQQAEFLKAGGRFLCHCQSR